MFEGRALATSVSEAGGKIFFIYLTSADRFRRHQPLVILLPVMRKMQLASERRETHLSPHAHGSILSSRGVYFYPWAKTQHL